MTTPVLGVIPVRLDSTRLPEKPLHPIGGRPLLEWVWGRVAEMEIFHRVVVATDHRRIRDLCLSLGAEVLLTDPAHPSGTDRVAEVARMPAFSHYDVVVNIQGDEPLVRESHLDAAVALLTEDRWELGTCATPLGSLGELEDPSVVKVVRSHQGRALYFSRAPIPHRRDGLPTGSELAATPFLRHVGLYTYRREALLGWVELPPSPLEETERLEQLRALEGGFSMGVAVVDRAAPGVDTPEDVVRMEKLLVNHEPSIPHLDAS